MFTYGTQVNPSLLRQDFSPILQAAQAQAQATQQAAAIRAQSIANIGSTIGGAIQTYVQKKEEKEKRKGSIDFISGVFQSQPNLAKTFKVPLDESGKPDQKALGSILDNFKSPDEAIRSFMALNEFAEQGKARQQQEQAASYAAMLRQGGGQVPSPVSNQALAQFSPQARVAGEAAFLATEQARANLAKTKAEEKRLLEESKPKTLTAPAGYRYLANGDLQPIPGGPAAQKEKPPEGYQWKPGPFAKAVLEPIPGGPAAVKAEETLSKQEAEKQAKEALAADAKLAAATTLGQIGKARPLIDSFFAQGFGSSIGGFFGGTPAQDLEQAYDVIRANEALTRIIALKKASPTGSTGFGALNLKELEVLQSRFAKLSRASSDKSAKEALNDLEGVLLKAFPDLKQTKASQSTPVRTRRFDPASGRLIDVAGDRVD
jgi:hypothetical protein